VKYTIIHVDSRAKDQIAHNQSILGESSYVSGIKFFNGNSENILDVLNHWGIKTETWNPYDGRSFGPLPGEYGVWASNISVWDYMNKNYTDKMLVLEDDVLLEKDAKEIIKKTIKELPDNWDFLSLYSFPGQNNQSSESNIGKAYIHKSINQPAANQAMIYSKSGASKLIKLVKRKGIEYTVDCFIYKQAQLGFLNGYSLIPGKSDVLTHTYKETKSLIDPENKRLVEM
jgi:GR25 family glycosyltransferase involved in LPS biosynthesis